MKNRFLCPNCNAEEYFFDGEKLKCPNCNQYDFESALHESEGNDKYQKLSKINKPFFELVCGEIYNCDVEYNSKLEKTTIIPINSDRKSNKVFIIIDADYCLQKGNKIIDTIKTKSFSELWNLNIKNELHIEFDCAMIIGATDNDNSIVSYNGWILKNLELNKNSR